MSGDVNVGVVFGRLRRQMHYGVDQTDSTTDVHIVTPLDDFISKHRASSSRIPFSSLPPTCRNDFYGRA
jgi:hypothetical protein